MFVFIANFFAQYFILRTWRPAPEGTRLNGRPLLNSAAIIAVRAHFNLNSVFIYQFGLELLLHLLYSIIDGPLQERINADLPANPSRRAAYDASRRNYP
jgi:hypothetical protein